MVKVGDTIRLNGKKVKIIGRIAAGKHTRWTLDDGTVAVDLDHVEGVEVVAPELKRLPIKKSKEPQSGLVDPDSSLNGEDLFD